MSTISPEEIEHLAKLCRVGLAAEEKKKLSQDLERILAYVGELARVDTKNVPAMTGGTDLTDIARKDEERIDSYPAKDYLLEQVPRKAGRYVKAPRILE